MSGWKWSTVTFAVGLDQSSVCPLQSFVVVTSCERVTGQEQAVTTAQITATLENW